MPPLFNPCLTNAPSGDPGVFVPFLFNKRALAFDLGDICTLSPRDILKLSHIFITHTHMDHFIGFDQLLRIILGREQTIYLYGPKGFLKNIEGKLAGYSWNLVENFKNNLIIVVTEITKEKRVTQKYNCKKKFFPVSEPATHSAELPLLYEEPSFKVTASILDHSIPSLGFSLKEKYRINIRKDVLDKLGLTPGPWINEFKQAIFDKQNPDSKFKVLHEKNYSTTLNEYKLDDLVRQLVVFTKGQKISYIADVAYTPSNIEKIVELADNADHLFIEAAFLEKDVEHARIKQHLTARQAGEIAGLAGVKRFTLFHFSPRYSNSEPLFYQEAMSAYTKHSKRGDKIEAMPFQEGIEGLNGPLTHND